MLRRYTRTLNLNIISRIERDLKPCDLISMIFLLYDNPKAAYNSVLLVEQDEDSRGFLNTWAEDALQNPTWKEKFIEALCLCQLHNVIARLGLDFESVNGGFSNTHYVDPMKKALYKLCEHMTKDYFEKLKKALSSYNVCVANYKSCELVMLKLMCDSFITVDHSRGQRESIYKIEMLAKIIERIPDLKPIAEELRDVRKTYCSADVDTSAAIMHDNNEPMHDNNEPPIEKYTVHHFYEEFNMLANMDMDLPSDSSHLSEDMYPIKNPCRVGTCYIINEEIFFPSKDSIDNCTTLEPLEDRHGSVKDRTLLQTTMLSLNFKVCYSDNLDHKKIYSRIAHVLRNEVEKDDSIFVLCILSHGVKGCIVAADCVKVEIERIQNLVGVELYKRGIDIPKVMIIQACQSNDIASKFPEKKPELLSDEGKIVELSQDAVTSVIADGPIAKAKKADFLICKATSPELNAYRSVTRTEGRSEHNGSIFITKLCENIKKYAKSKHLCEILVKVNREIADYFKGIGHDQYSMSENSLTKDLYLQVPN